MKFFTFSFVISFLFVSCISNQNDTVRNERSPFPDSLDWLLTLEEYNEGWEPLFDGVTLNGWKEYQQTDIGPGWIINDSILITKGNSNIHPGDLISIQQFEDFELYLEWSICWQGNSGIFFHSLENSWAPWVMGPEYSIVDQANLNKLESIYETGANYGVHPPLLDCVGPQGSFNSTRIKVQDAHVQHWLNGELVVAYEIWSADWYERVATSKWKDYPQYGRPLKGSIALQGHGFETKFRNIKIRDITDFGKPFLEILNLERWQLIGTNKTLSTVDPIIINGQNTGIIGSVKDEKLDKNFVIRFQFMPINQDTLLIDFNSQEIIHDIEEFKIDIDSSMKVNEHRFFILLASPKKDPTHKGEWNDLVIRRKNDQLLVWLNNNMIIERNKVNIPKNLNYFSILFINDTNREISLRNLFYKELN